MEFISGMFFTKQRKQIFQVSNKLYEGMELHTKNIKTIKQTHKIMMDYEKRRD